jgi:hypothetical protein
MLMIIATVLIGIATMIAIMGSLLTLIATEDDARRFGLPIPSEVD